MLTNQIDDDNWIGVDVFAIPPLVILFPKQKGSHVRRENGRVHHQDQYYPIPHSLKGRVVQEGPLVIVVILQLLVQQYVSAQGSNLMIRIQ